MDKIKTWCKNGFKVELFDTYTRDSYGKHILGYKFYDGKELVFEGQDFHCSPMHSIDSKETIMALLGFLSCKPGDVDEEYFASYTPRQLDWANSARCEELSYLVND